MAVALQRRELQAREGKGMKVSEFVALVAVAVISGLILYYVTRGDKVGI